MIGRNKLKISGNTITKGYARRSTFLRELHALRNLKNHPNIIQILDFNETPEIMMEYAPNYDLYNWVKRFQNKTPATIARYFLKSIIMGLEYAQRCSVYHRDVKMDNLVIDQYGVIKIIDWDLCSLNRTSVSYVGTLGYMAPELLMRYKYDCSKSDVWSVGVTFFAIIFAKRPYTDIEKRPSPEDRSWIDNWLIAIKNDNWRKIWNSFLAIPPVCDDLFEDLLVWNPNKRIDYEHLLTHDYLCREIATGKDVLNYLKR
jgi:serine/threonine protein kinase